jgi:hypothetical protein
MDVCEEVAWKDAHRCELHERNWSLFNKYVWDTL